MMQNNKCFLKKNKMNTVEMSVSGKFTATLFTADNKMLKKKERRKRGTDMLSIKRRHTLSKRKTI